VTLKVEKEKDCNDFNQDFFVVVVIVASYEISFSLLPNSETPIDTHTTNSISSNLTCKNRRVSLASQANPYSLSGKSI
jgi:hypothetical protein